MGVKKVVFKCGGKCYSCYPNKFNVCNSLPMEKRPVKGKGDEITITVKKGAK